jgi:carbon monoxide dehydrogenase subunit G
MKLQYNGQEKIKADYDTVWKFINDPNEVSKCLPDTEKVDIKDDKSFDAFVKVGVGPVKGKFKFSVTLVPQPENKKMMVKLRGGGLGTAIDLEAGADIKEQADKSTLLDWNGQADVRGPAATVGGRILDSKAKELISHVFAEVGRKLNS